MKERGILFTPENYGKVDDGSKSQTRRIIKPKWWRCLDPEDEDDRVKAIKQCPYGIVGGRLYVKEGLKKDGPYILYRRGLPERVISPDRVYKLWEWQKGYLSPLHMPRWAARLWLEITDVRVERLQEITEADAIAEGCPSDLRRETWWQGYRSDMRDRDGNLLHWQAPRCDAPPPTMLDPKQMTVTSGNTAIYNYRVLWHQIHGPLSWDMNPWLWCLTFKKVRD